MKTIPEAGLPGGHGDADGEACISNISLQERRKRLIGGVIPFVLAMAILTWQISIHVDRLWRLSLFIFFIAAASGFFNGTTRPEWGWLRAVRAN